MRRNTTTSGIVIEPHILGQHFSSFLMPCAARARQWPGTLGASLQQILLGTTCQCRPKLLLLRNTSLVARLMRLLQESHSDSRASPIANKTKAYTIRVLYTRLGIEGHFLKPGPPERRSSALFVTRRPHTISALASLVRWLQISSYNWWPFPLSLPSPVGDRSTAQHAQLKDLLPERWHRRPFSCYCRRNFCLETRICLRLNTTR
ncbi:hypothetical protein B0H67DRAFT_197473 [Lasiosphaeris hirsuta]|uniref:Uncharacterized protein n=1 Tax=Lasiosphaeris hirsuta TaxID=260670 RepID=A0AA40ARG5_9PEZI|nr:hypothetical protein B0H67DRAFT_197473 [Lasiosphaeris hirsuta]